jgi:hypothetical protein
MDRKLGCHTAYVVTLASFQICAGGKTAAHSSCKSLPNGVCRAKPLVRLAQVLLAPCLAAATHQVHCPPVPAEATAMKDSSSFECSSFGT